MAKVKINLERETRSIFSLAILATYVLFGLALSSCKPRNNNAKSNDDTVSNSTRATESGSKHKEKCDVTEIENRRLAVAEKAMWVSDPLEQATHEAVEVKSLSDDNTDIYSWVCGIELMCRYRKYCEGNLRFIDAAIENLTMAEHARTKSKEVYQKAKDQIERIKNKTESLKLKGGGDVYEDEDDRAERQYQLIYHFDKLLEFMPKADETWDELVNAVKEYKKIKPK
jgi:hypothetical protein